MPYTDTTPTDGFFERTLGFYWDEQRSFGPKYVTIDFQLSDEMKTDYPGYNETNTWGYTEKSTEQERWIAENLPVLLDFGFVIEVIDGPNRISTVPDLETNLPKMDFDSFYR